jgi:NDP-sugar pyrophosphorylase family protein
VLDDEALERLPERGDHEQSTFPELAARAKLSASGHEGPLDHREHAEDLQRAEEHYARIPSFDPRSHVARA